jgi:hypothetical protein
MQESWPSASTRRCRNLLIRYMPVTLVIIIAALLGTAASAQSPSLPNTGNANLNDILAYIHKGWDSLTRSTSSCAAVADTKLSGAPLLYLPAGFPAPKELDQMQRDCQVTIARLPQVIHQLGTTDTRSIQPQDCFTSRISTSSRAAVSMKCTDGTDYPRLIAGWSRRTGPRNGG